MVSLFGLRLQTEKVLIWNVKNIFEYCRVARLSLIALFAQEVLEEMTVNLEGNRMERL